jgi:N-acetyl-beta-hexosaminidase
MEVAIPNVPGDQILGVQTLHWSEHIRTPERLYELAWPRATAVAEVGWSGDNRGEYADFLNRLRKMFPLFEEMGICATEEAGWDPEPAEAEAQRKAFSQQFEDASDAELYEQQLAQM